MSGFSEDALSSQWNQGSLFYMEVSMCMGYPCVNVPVMVDVHRSGGQRRLSPLSVSATFLSDRSLTVCGDNCYFSEVSGQSDPMILLCLTTQPSNNRSR